MRSLLPLACAPFSRKLASHQRLMLNKTDLLARKEPTMSDYGPDPANEDVTLFNLVEDQQMFHKMLAQKKLAEVRSVA